MGLTIAKKTPSKIMLGETEVQKVFLGSQLVWKKELVEGEDYERYDWLVGDGEAYFQTTLNFMYYMYDFGNIKIIDSSQKKGLFFHWIRPDDKWVNCFLEYNSNGVLKFAWHGGSGTATISLQEGGLNIKPRVVSAGRYNGTCVNNKRIFNINDGWFLPSNVVTANAKMSTPYGIGVSKMEVTDIRTDKIVYTRTPVKLLSNCPAYLSINGKTYNSGECGMIDAATGKFWGGNGAFSVYNDPVNNI